MSYYNRYIIKSNLVMDRKIIFEDHQLPVNLYCTSLQVIAI